jgi:MFS family permease
MPRPEAGMTDHQQSILDRGLKLAAPRSLYFFIFAVSGFSGLIYESIWTHYLKLFLGHAAYAQSLVLIIFMGGMALGSWLASRYSARSKSPLLIYAGVELIVGILALVFHDVFTSVIESFYAAILPSVGSPALGAVLKWLAASALIMPQSVLLGMTFPMMSAGIIRRFPDTPGGSIAMLYFTNSIGAAIGVLASGFWLINLVGLPGTIFTAGLLNVMLAITVWMLVRLDPAPVTTPIASEPSTETTSTLKQLFLVAAFITGAASFIYEISWIRMLSLVLGATTHSFELMLSAFITGLAFGGLWIKRRIDRIESPVRFSGYVQLIMGVLALLTIPVYVYSFDWMSWLMQALDRTEAGYTGYSVASDRIERHVAHDLHGRHDLTAVHLRADPQGARRRQHRPGICCQYHRRYRRRACRGPYRAADTGPEGADTGWRGPGHRARRRITCPGTAAAAPSAGSCGRCAGRLRCPRADHRARKYRSQAPGFGCLSSRRPRYATGRQDPLLPGRQDGEYRPAGDEERLRCAAH